MADEHVLVIGAGPAGLTAAYYLERANIRYRIVDRASIIGSTWASLYPSLTLNTPNFASNLAGESIDWRHGFYMSGRQFYQHLAAFARKHDFDVAFGVEVFRVAPEGDGWRVESSEGVAHYPAVMIATGKFSNPIAPQIPGLDSFTGAAIHAHQFRDPADYAGQRVLVVGNGPSGADIAVALTETAALPVLLSIRSDILVARRYPFGLPTDVWRVLTGWMPERYRRPLLNFLSYQSYPNMAQYGLKTGRNREDRLGTSAPVRGPELIDAIRAGKLKAVAGLERVDGPCAELADGSRHAVDLIVLATGYRPAVGYLDFPFDTDRDGWPVRDQGQEVAGYPGLYIVGRFYQGRGPLYNIKEEAGIAVQQIQKRLASITATEAAQTHKSGRYLP